MQELLMGETPEPVSARSEDEKTFINRETASALGISPDVSTFLEAEMVGQVPSGAKATRSDRSSAMTLREAVDLALDGNLEIQAADAGVRIVEEDANEARSPLLPQLNLNIGGRIIDGDRALPTNREYQASWGAGLRQVVYDERAWGGFSSAKDLRQAAQEDRERTQLDVIYRVVTSYIELLRVRTILEIQKRDLALSQENLDMARVRQRVGQAGLEEVYRWQTRIADSQRQLLDVQARLQTSRLALNVLVNRPVDSALSPEALSVNSPQLLCSSQTFQDHLTTQNRFQLLAAFLVREGMARAPELKGFDAQIQAVRRQVSAENRSYFIPTVAVEAGLNHRFARGGDGQLPDALSVTGLGANPLDWQVGVSAQLPLFEGALKASRVGRGNAQAGQLSLQKQNTKLVVEQNVRQALYIAAASFATIGITEGAVKAASGNLRIIQEKYQRGRATIIQLLDAQNQSVVAENEAANAVFVFLSDLMRVERAIGRFDFLVTPEEQAQFLRNLAGYQPDQTAVPTP